MLDGHVHRLLLMTQISISEKPVLSTKWPQVFKLIHAASLIMALQSAHLVPVQCHRLSMQKSKDMSDEVSREEANDCGLKLALSANHHLQDISATFASCHV